MNCSLGDDKIPSYEDTCSFTCNNGHELSGSGTRTCQSDGSWSGNNAVCIKGNSYIQISVDALYIHGIYITTYIYNFNFE